MNILQCLKQCREHQEQNTLTKSLSDYGLSPSDWHIKHQEGNIYRIENKDEPHFFFRGTVHKKKGRREWGSISLSGL